MLENLFTAFLKVSVTTTVLILIILVLEKRFSQAYTAKWKYFLWLIIIIRLIIPVHDFSDINFISLPAPPNETGVITESPGTGEASFSPEEPEPGQANLGTGPDADAPLSFTQDIKPVATGEGSNLSPASGETSSLMETAAVIWVIGVVFFLLYRLVAYFAVKVHLKRWYRINSDKRPQELLSQIKNEMKIKRRVEIRICSKITGPLTLGFIKPTILIPNLKFTEEQLRLILIHELVHIKRWDTVYKLLVMLACALHFYNPVVYLLARRINRDLEISCDEEVVKGRDARYRKKYGQALLELIRESKTRETAFFTYFQPDKHDLQKRLKALMDTTSKKRGLAALGVAGIMAVVMAGTVVAWVPEPVKIEEGEAVQLSDRSKFYFYQAEELVLSAGDLKEALHRDWEEIGGGELVLGLEDMAHHPYPSMEGKLLGYPVYSPDENYLAFILQNPGKTTPYAAVGMLEMDTGELFFTRAVPERINSMGWSPDGTRLAYQTRTVEENYTHAVYVDKVSEPGSGYVLQVQESNALPNSLVIEEMFWSHTGEELNLIGEHETSEDKYHWDILVLVEDEDFALRERERVD